MSNRRSDSLAGAPAMKMGFLKKKSRSGFIKNWQRRFFVLTAGQIYYYEKKMLVDEPPYGEQLKGELGLQGAATITADQAKFPDPGNKTELVAFWSNLHIIQQRMILLLKLRMPMNVRIGLEQ